MSVSKRHSATPPLSQEDDAVSRRLVDARLNTSPLQAFPGTLPDSLERAYAIQTASINRWPDDVAGWKVAKLPGTDRTRFAAERLAGPVFSSSVQTTSSGSCQVMPVYEGGFAAVEAEIILELGTKVEPTRQEYSDEELTDLIAGVYGGAEIASSPMALVNQLGAMSIISDFGSNAGLVVGPTIADWRSLATDGLTATVTVDDVLVGSTTTDVIAGVPLQALRFLIGLSASRGVELPEGTLISTGALTGVHEVRMSSTARIDYGSYGGFDLKFEPMTPISYS